MSFDPSFVAAIIGTRKYFCNFLSNDNDPSKLTAPMSLFDWKKLVDFQYAGKGDENRIDD